MKNLHESPDDAIYGVRGTPDIPLLHALGIFDGAKIIKKTTYPGSGPSLIEVDGREIAIGMEYATEITVEKKEVAEP